MLETRLIALNDTLSVSSARSHQDLASPSRIQLYGSCISIDKERSLPLTTAFVGEVPQGGSEGVVDPVTAIQHHLDYQANPTKMSNAPSEDHYENTSLQLLTVQVQYPSISGPNAMVPKCSMGEIMDLLHHQKRSDPSKAVQPPEYEAQPIQGASTTPTSKLSDRSSGIGPVVTEQIPTMRYQRNQAIPSSQISVKIYIVAMLLSIVYCLA